MKIMLFAPYGSFHQEAQFFSSIADELRRIGVTVSQLICNGVFSLCERDAATSWQRGFMSCIVCNNEQMRILGTKPGEQLELSKFISPEKVKESSDWVASLQKGELAHAVWEDLQLGEISNNSIKQRAKFYETNEEALAKRHLLVSARLVSALSKLFSEYPVELTLIPAGVDFITQVTLSTYNKYNQRYYTAAWQPAQKSFIFSNTEVLSQLVQNISYEWNVASEATHTELFTKLGIVAKQMPLPFR